MSSAPGQVPGASYEPHLPARCPPPAPVCLFPGVGDENSRLARGSGNARLPGPRSGHAFPPPTAPALDRAGRNRSA